MNTALFELMCKEFWILLDQMTVDIKVQIHPYKVPIVILQKKVHLLWTCIQIQLKSN